MNPFITPSCKRSVIVAALMLSQTLLLSPAVVQAADGAVRIAGQVIFVNKAGSGGMSIGDRSETIQRNLDNALVAAKDRSPSSVNIVYVKGIPMITLGGYQIVTVDGDNAKANATTPALLAQRWADALRQSLRDTASIDSYVAQLSGTYQSSAPAPLTSTTPSQPVYSPPAGNQLPQQPYGASPPASYNPPGQNWSAGGNIPYSPYNQPYAAQQPGSSYDQFNRNTYPPASMQRGRVVYAPAGLVLPVTLNTSISTQVAQMGDFIQATLAQPVNLGDSTIPAGSVLIGQISEAKAGGFMGRSGMLGIKFNRLRTPDGVETPITAHIMGGIGKYTEVGSDDSDVVRGETWKNKVGQVALRGAIGAGTGAALGTAIGAIAGRGGRGAGRGAWSGTAIGGGLGVADSLLLRKGRDVTIHSGLPMQVQLDAPVAISGGGTPPYTGAL